MLYGEHDRHLSRIEHQLGVTLASRGNRITVRGAREQSDQALLVLNSLWDRLQQGLPVGDADIDAVISMVGDPELDLFAEDDETNGNSPEEDKGNNDSWISFEQFRRSFSGDFNTSSEGQQQYNNNVYGE